MPQVWTLLMCLLAVLAGCAEHPPLDVATGELRYAASKVPGYSTAACRVDGQLMAEADIDAPTPLGFSGRDVVTTFNDHAGGMMIWEDDQSATPLMLAVIAAPHRVTSSGDVPRYQGYCVPMLEVRGAVVAAWTLDGRIDEQLHADVIGMSDGRGGIGAFFLTRATMAPQAMRGALEMPMELMREGEVAALSIDLSWSADGAFRACCADGMPISEDPSEACSTYPGRLRFTSRPESIANDPNVLPAGYLDVALARIEL